MYLIFNQFNKTHLKIQVKVKMKSRIGIHKYFIPLLQ